MAPMLTMAMAMAASASNGADGRDPFSLHWTLYPRHYVAPKVTSPITIDGNLSKSPWDKVPFSDVFDEIRGPEDAPPGTRPTAAQQTKMKMAWDDNYLYVAAILESDFTTHANFTQRNSPIFQKDSDFEVFVDPHGTCHNYKELEVNAINTIWNLMLDKPYDDGGVEHSGRIAKEGDKDYYEVYKQKTATKVIKGKVNDRNGGTTWTIECALAHSDVLAHTTKHAPPTVGTRWRINFSRVEHQGDTNWTWQAQRIWDPILRKVAGKVAMHLPDSWGYVQFGRAMDESNSGKPDDGRDPSWPARLAAMNVYYAQRRYAELNKGQYASTLDELRDLIDPMILKPFERPDSTGHGGITMTTTLDRKFYVASVTTPDNKIKATVNHERLLTVDAKGSELETL
jgi:Carbohydrate family 9 binding domain-like